MLHAELPGNRREAVGLVLLLLPPLVLSAVYSLFFEPSKFYGCLTLFLASAILLAQPVTWYWLKLYFPIGLAFVVFCAVVRALKSTLGG
jgi:hypothetical protein